MKENEINLVLTPEDMKGNYFDVTGCPIHRALTRMGYKVGSVGGDNLNIGKINYHIKDGNKIGNILSGSKRDIYLEKVITLIKM